MNPRIRDPAHPLDVAGAGPSVVARLRRRFGSGEGFDQRLLAPLVSGAVLNPINSSIIAVALVPIGAALGQPPSATAWLISSLYLATAVGQPVVGRLIDVYGPRRLFLPATALVGVAGVAGTLAPNLGVLILARVVLGFGTCAGYPAAMRLIRGEAERTGRDSPAGVLTILAISTQTVAVIGPPLGGLLIGIGGWRATLAVNVPVAILAFVLGARRLPKQAAARPSGAAGLDLDLTGMVLFASTLVSLLLFLMSPHVDDWYLPVITVLAAAAFARRELRHAAPFIDLRILGGNRPLLLTYARSLLAYIVSYGFLYGYTQWLEDGRGLSAGQAGLVTLPLFATAIVVSAMTGRRNELWGKFAVAATGQVLACALLLTLDRASPVWLLIGVMLILGVPQGLNSLALQNSVYRQADPETIGASAGLLRTSGYLGAIIASTAQGAFFGRTADTGGLHHLALFLFAVAAAFLLITFVDRSLRSSSGAPPTDGPPSAESTPAVPQPSKGESRD